MSIRVVTDSSCDLPQSLVDALRIEIVPLTIRFGDEELVDREELSTDEFWHRLEHSKLLPETAAPSAGAFEAKFRELQARGATGIVCINLSSHLSATMQAAQVAAAAVSSDIPVQVIDSQSASMGLGNLCLTAARRAADGDSLESIVQRGGQPARPHQALRHPRHARVPQAGWAGRQRPRAARHRAVDQAGHRAARRHRRGGGQGPHPLQGAEGCSPRRRRKGRSSTSRCCTATPPTSTSCSSCWSRSSPATTSSPAIVGPVIGTHAGPRVIGVTFQVVR